jgi:hypothetical protein
MRRNQLVLILVIIDVEFNRKYNGLISAIMIWKKLKLLRSNPEPK